MRVRVEREAIAQRTDWIKFNISITFAAVEVDEFLELGAGHLDKVGNFVESGKMIQKRKSRFSFKPYP